MYNKKILCVNNNNNKTVCVEKDSVQSAAFYV